MRKVVGLGISLQKTAVCVLDHDGQLVWQGKVDREPGPLIEKLRLWRDQIDVVRLDACPLSEWLHRHLVAAGFKAICVETRHAQRFLSTRPVKTERARVAVARKHAVIMHRMWVFGERVRDRSREAGVGCRVVGTGFGFTPHDHNRDDGTGQSDTPPGERSPEWTTRSEIGRRTLVSHPGAAASQTQNRSATQAYGHCETRRHMTVVGP